MRVLLLGMYSRLAASSRVRSLQYLPYLAARGIDVTPAPLFGDDYVRDLFRGRHRNWGAIVAAGIRRLAATARCGRFDLVWIERELFPYLPAWAETALSFAGIPFVVDYDDAVFHKYDANRNAFVRALLGKKVDAVMRRAATVIAGNGYVEERALKAGAKRVVRIPTVIDLDRYPFSPRSDKKVFTIGWIGSPGTSPYLRQVRAALAEVCGRGEGRVVLVGSGDVGLQDVPVSIRPWSEETEAAEIREFDVGIMPVPDEPWERGKSGYKLIQYMGCGLPVVASPVGANRRIVEDGVTGFLASTQQDWVRSLATLRDDPRLRDEMGRRGRRRVEQEYCLRVTAPRLAGLLFEAAGQPAPRS